LGMYFIGLKGTYLGRVKNRQRSILTKRVLTKRVLTKRVLTNRVYGSIFQMYSNLIVLTCSLAKGEMRRRKDPRFHFKL
jgi:hypothetical protein